MTVGIYSLFWEEQNLIYIGLSSNIEDRFIRHRYTMRKNTHDNYKVQQAFNNFGLPSFSILEECTEDKLSELEIAYISEFDSINTGLNIIEGGSSSYGIRHTTSKYSKFQILKVFCLLAKTDMSYKDISFRTKVPKTTIAAISSKRVHGWLSKYSDYYTLATRDREIICNRNRAISRVGIGTKKYRYVLISPEDTRNNIECITTFLRENKDLFPNLNAAQQGFSKIIHGKSQSYKKWKCTRYEV